MRKAKWWRKLDVSFVGEALKVQAGIGRRPGSEKEESTCHIYVVEDINKIHSSHRHIWMESTDGHSLILQSPHSEHFGDIFANRRFPNIETITIVRRVSEYLIEALVKACPNITSIEFRKGPIDHVILQFDTFLAVLTNCKKLEILKSEYELTDYPDNVPLDLVRRNCQNLIYFHVSESEISRQFAKYILHHTQKLQFIRSKDILYVRPSVTLKELANQLDEVQYNVEDEDYNSQLFKKIIIY